MKEILFSFENEHKRGVLRNMFGSPQYWNLFTYKSTDHYSIYGPRNAFNFSNSNYWLGPKRDVPNNLTFCFKFFSVLATGYKIKTSQYENADALRCRSWGFSGSKDGIHWYNFQKKNYSLAPNEAIFVEWTYQIPLKCFQLTTLETVNGYFQNRCDVVEIHVFGYIVNDIVTVKSNLFINLMYQSFLYILVLNE